MTFKVGDKVKVIRTQPYSSTPPQDGEIVKVARKYATVSIAGRFASPEVLFDKETGYEKSVNGFESYRRIATPQQLAEEAERTRMLDRLRKVGVRIDNRKLSTAALREILALVAEVERAS